MSQTDPRAKAMNEMNERERNARRICNELVVLGGAERESFILHALADAERVGMERAAKIADDFDRLTCAEMERKYRLRIDVRRLNLGDNIARCIRSQAQAEGIPS